jgi:hypothetical protein
VDLRKQAKSLIKFCPNSLGCLTYCAGNWWLTSAILPDLGS